MKTIKKFKLTNIVAIMAIMLFVAVAWALLANNAFATDDEAPVAEPNEEISSKQESNSIQISFDIKGVEQGDAPKFTLKDWYGLVDYKLGDKISVNKNSLRVDYSDDLKTIEAEDLEGEPCLYQFKWSCFGYDFVSFEPASKPQQITQDTDFIITLKKTTKPYTIGVQAQQYKEGKWINLPGISVTYYDPNYRYIAGPLITDSEGKCKFENLTKSDAIGILTYKGENICDQLSGISEESYSYDDGHRVAISVSLFDVSTADVILKSEDPLHKAFDIQTFVGPLSGSANEEAKVHYISDSLAIRILSANYNTYATVNEDGTVGLYTPREPQSDYWRAEIKPLCEEGYYAKSWMVDTGENEFQPLNPGETVTVAAGNKFSAYPVYDVIPPQPGPEPTPTPTEEVAAQTGDSAPLVPFVLLAVLAGGVLLYTRKLAKN